MKFASRFFFTCYYHVYVIAGESSGDKLGYHLVRSLQRMDNSLVVHGVGGPLLEKQGLQSLFPYEELSVMGLSSVLWRLPRLLYRLKQVERDILMKQPDAVIAIDSKGFSSRIFQRISPSVWAIKDGLRAAQQFGKWIDHVLLLFPLEAALWKQAHVPCTVVGPGFCENLEWFDSKTKYQRKDSTTTRLVALLGSRIQEVKKAAPLVMKCIQLLREEGFHDLQIIIPYVGHTRSWIENQIPYYSDVEWVNGEDEKAYLEALVTSDFAVAVSGI
ncbi:Lipid-A-disaccharide synthase [Galdieria sulphuraria]|nr:Lipid-A-disaccharide synthase [Galdieria sulphuraria]